MKLFSCPLVRRKLICIILGIAFGFLCTYFASTENPEIWGTALMWMIVFNRFLIGMVVFLAGAYTKNPLGFRMCSWFRGATLGALVCL